MADIFAILTRLPPAHDSTVVGTDRRRTLVRHRNGCVMLQRLTEEIAECYRHASEARDYAKFAHDPALRQDYLEMERRWIFLAHSYELSEQLQDFIKVYRR